MTDSNGAPDWQLMRALVCWYLVAMGYLDKIENYRYFKTNFKSACALVRKGTRNPVPTPKKSTMATDSRHGRQGSPDLPDHTTGDLEGTHSIHQHPDVPCAAKDASATNPLFSNLKRSLKEAETAYASLERDNKRLKIENDGLQRDKAQLDATRLRLEQEKNAITQELSGEKDSTRKLKQELATEKHARTAAEKKAVEDATKLEQAEKKAASKYENEMQDMRTELEQEIAIADKALAAKARLELQVQALESARNS